MKERINELNYFENELIEYEMIYYKLEFIEHDEIFCENELKSMIKSRISLIDVINCLLYSLSLHFNSFSILSIVINNRQSSFPNMRRVVIFEGS